MADEKKRKKSRDEVLTDGFAQYGPHDYPEPCAVSLVLTAVCFSVRPGPSTSLTIVDP